MVRESSTLLAGIAYAYYRFSGPASYFLSAFLHELTLYLRRVSTVADPGKLYGLDILRGLDVRSLTRWAEDVLHCTGLDDVITRYRQWLDTARALVERATGA